MVNLSLYPVFQNSCGTIKPLEVDRTPMRGLKAWSVPSTVCKLAFGPSCETRSSIWSGRALGSRGPELDSTGFELWERRLTPSSCALPARRLGRLSDWSPARSVLAG